MIILNSLKLVNTGLLFQSFEALNTALAIVLKFNEPNRSTKMGTNHQYLGVA